MRFWCLSTSARNWSVCFQHRLFGLDFRYFTTWDRYLSGGDRAVIYAGSPIQGFVASCTIGKKQESDAHIGWTKGKAPYLFRYRFSLQDLKIAEPPLRISYTCSGAANDVPELLSPNGFLNDVIFIADKSQTWNQYVQVSIVAITDEDYSTVASRIAGHSQESL